MKLLKRLGLALALILVPFAAFAQSTCPAGSQVARLITTTNYTVGQTDQCATLVFNNSGAIAVSLPAPGTAGGFLPGYFNFTVQVIGAGTVTITPSRPFSGSAPTVNGQSTAQVVTNQGVFLYVGTDANYYGVGTLGNSSTGGQTASFFNATGPKAYQQYGTTVLNEYGTGSITFAGVTCNSNCDVLGGFLAGANLPSNDFLTTCFGWNACGTQNITRPELVCMGWNACGQGSGTNVNFDVAIGINSLGNCLTDCQGTVAIGIDSGRGAFATENNILIGEAAGDHADYTGSIFIGNSAGLWPGTTTSTVTQNNIGIGVSAMQGANATTAVDNICLGSNCMSSLTTAQRIVAIGVSAASACTTCNGNTLLGWKAGVNGTTFTNSNVVGFNSLGGVFTGSSVNIIGANSGDAITSGSTINSLGQGNVQQATTATRLIVIGDSSLQNCTTCLGNTIIGNSAANSMHTGFDNIVIAAGDTIDVADGTSHTINISNIWTATGTGTPSTSVSTVAGNLEVGATTFTISGCSATTPVGSGTVGTYTSGTSGTCTVTVTLNGATGMTAPHGWSCWANDLTTPADVQHQTAASNTTTAVISGTTVSGDVVNFGCLPY